MPRDKSGKAKRWSDDRNKRRDPKPRKDHGRERNIGHRNAEEHNRNNRGRGNN